MIKDIKVPHSKTKDCELTEGAKISFFGILNPTCEIKVFSKRCREYCRTLISTLSKLMRPQINCGGCKMQERKAEIIEKGGMKAMNS